MSALTAPELWQALLEQSLVKGELPRHDNPPVAPWYVRVMQGVAGWIGALFLFGFMGAAFATVIDSAEASLLLGLIGCGAAYGIFRISAHNDFASQFGLAVSFAAQGLFINGVFKAVTHDPAAVCFILFLFESVLAFVIPNFIHRVLSSCASMLALSYALSITGIHGFPTGITAALFAIIWLNEWNWSKHDKIFRPMGYGLALALLQTDTLYFLGYDVVDFWSQTENLWLMLHAHTIGTAFVTLTLLCTIKRLLDKEHLAPQSPAGLMAFGSALVLGVLSFCATGMATALLILLMGFAGRNRLLIGLGLIALGGFLSHYYYVLHHSLLFKSMVLGVTGLLLLLVHWGLKKFFTVTDAKESGHA